MKVIKIWCGWFWHRCLPAFPSPGEMLDTPQICIAFRQVVAVSIRLFNLISLKFFFPFNSYCNTSTTPHNHTLFISSKHGVNLSQSIALNSRVLTSLSYKRTMCWQISNTINYTDQMLKQMSLFNLTLSSLEENNLSTQGLKSQVKISGVHVGKSHQIWV